MRSSIERPGRRKCCSWKNVHKNLEIWSSAVQSKYATEKEGPAMRVRGREDAASTRPSPPLRGVPVRRISRAGDAVWASAATTRSMVGLVNVKSVCCHTKST